MFNDKFQILIICEKDEVYEDMLLDYNKVNILNTMAHELMRQILTIGLDLNSIETYFDSGEFDYNPSDIILGLETISKDKRFNFKDFEYNCKDKLIELMECYFEHIGMLLSNKIIVNN